MRTTRKAIRRAIGFTLIELLVVIAVIILLMAILVPVLQRAAGQARETQCLANVKQMIAAFTAYHGNYKGFLPSPAHRDEISDLNDPQYWDGDPNFTDETNPTDNPPYTWKGKIISYIGTSNEENPDQKYGIFKCPAVRLFKRHKSFYGINAYLGMHVPEKLRDSDGYYKMIHAEDIEQHSKTYLIGENNTGHWAVKPSKHPREASDFTAASDDAKCFARHFKRGSWAFLDGHTERATITDNEKNHCWMWVPNKTEHREQYGSGN